MMKSAVIGLGVAGCAHAEYYSSNASDFLLAAVCPGDDPFLEATVLKQHTTCDNPADMLSSVRPDICSITTPLPRRTDDIMQCLEAGVHVIASLPFAYDRETLQTMKNTAAENGVVLAGDFHLRFSPAMDTALQWYAEGHIGTPLFINVSLWSDEKPFSTNELFYRLGCHGVDLMRQFCGDIHNVQCFTADSSLLENDAGSDQHPSAQINLRFADDIAGNLTICQGLSTRHPFARLELAGTKGRLLIENVYEQAMLFIHADPEKRGITNSIFGGVPQLSATHGLRIEKLVGQISAEETPDGGCEDALASFDVMSAALRSAENGTVEELSPQHMGGM